MMKGSGQTKRTRGTAEVARQALEEWRASGLPLEAYARRRGIVAQRLRWWCEGRLDGRATRLANRAVTARVR